ncbi:hypothetical protein [Parvularcula lutaonensis]|uniref:Uncharacterized protein n=1 Tax=Parvularcula lutaonensis TaxID=491923 RepID=A0ABV7M9E7_9PROT|nr:hypothetical protein [Parvularcula lutaonensis]GGY45135.1 hypothetical protein GCM10007148_12630 [Parvularcula lutaonensis]
MSSPEDLIRQHALLPHPFEGHWRETAHVKGIRREGLQLLTALDEAGWHGVEAEVSYTLEEGGPVALSLSSNRRTAYGYRLLTPGDAVKVGPAVLRAISCLGGHALLRLRLEPDVALTDRQLMPDDWYPQPDGV